MVDDQAVWLTPAAHRKLVDELQELMTNGRNHMSERIAEARSHGDISENGDYDAAKHEQGLMEARIRKLQYILDTAEVRDAEVTDEVTVGCVAVGGGAAGGGRGGRGRGAGRPRCPGCDCSKPSPPGSAWARHPATRRRRRVTGRPGPGPGASGRTRGTPATA